MDISMGCYRIAAFRAQQAVRGVACGKLHPIHLGIGTPNGCESIVHNLQHVLKQPQQPVAALTIDFANAFNAVSRQAVLSSLYSMPALSSLFRIVDFAYSEPSDLLVRDKNRQLYPGVFSVQGVRQGDPLSSLLFALTVHPVYQAVVTNHPSVQATAIHDDVTLVGPPDDLVQAYRTVVEQAKTINLHVQPHKCQLVYFHNETEPLSSLVTNFIRNHRISYQDEAAVILGAPIGTNHESVERLATTMLKDQLAILDYLLHDAMPVQEAMLLLRISSTHKLDYLLRCVRPAAMH